MLLDGRFVLIIIIVIFLVLLGLTELVVLWRSASLFGRPGRLLLAFRGLVATRITVCLTLSAEPFAVGHSVEWWGKTMEMIRFFALSITILVGKGFELK